MSSGARPGTLFGKWAQAGVPKKGWVCVETEDLGSPDETCEMCERERIRYVHTMTHDNYPDDLRCGCVCAGHMEEDLAGAKDRDRRLKSATRRRLKWPDREGWHHSPKGNLTIKDRGYRVTIYERKDGWGGVVSHELSGYRRPSRLSHPTIRAAQLAAFDVMEFHRHQG